MEFFPVALKHHKKCKSGRWAVVKWNEAKWLDWLKNPSWISSTFSPFQPYGAIFPWNGMPFPYTWEVGMMGMVVMMMMKMIMKMRIIISHLSWFGPNRTVLIKGSYKLKGRLTRLELLISSHSNQLTNPLLSIASDLIFGIHLIFFKRMQK